jgi:hypothetical protein
MRIKNRKMRRRELERGCGFDRIVSYHEAGHAVASLLLAEPIDYVTIRPSFENISGALKRAEIELLDDDNCVSIYKLQRILIILWSGMQAEHRAYPNRLYECMRGAGVGRAGRKNAGDYFVIKTIAGWCCQRDEQEEKKLIESTSHKANSLVRINWCLIEKVSGALLKHKTLSGDKVRDIIGWKRCQRAYRDYTSPDELEWLRKCAAGDFKQQASANQLI